MPGDREPRRNTPSASVAASRATVRSARTALTATASTGRLSVPITVPVIALCAYTGAASAAERMTWNRGRIVFTRMKLLLFDPKKRGSALLYIGMGSFGDRLQQWLG